MNWNCRIADGKQNDELSNYIIIKGLMLYAIQCIVYMYA